MGSDETTVLIVTREDPRLYAYSPSLPGFVFGANTAEEFWRDVRPAIVWAGGKPDLTVYIQRPYETPEGVEWLLRVLQDDQMEARTEIAQRIHATVMQTDQRYHLFTDAHPTPTGEYVFQCALFTDTVGSVVRALRSGEDTVIVAAAAADQLWYAQEIGAGPAKSGEVALASLGLSSDSTIFDLMKAIDGKDTASELQLGRLVTVG